MIKKIFLLLFRAKKWKLDYPAPEEAKNSIVVAAPHTSNWDFVYTITALDQLHLNPRFTIKKEFNKFPVGSFIASMGAIWIDRSVKNKGEKRPSMTKVMASLFNQKEESLCVVVTPEGTRSKNTQWKTGFYYSALEAKVPICLAYMDYKTRRCGVDFCFMPSGDIEKDMKIMMDFYKDKTGKKPEYFSLDERYTT
ncbi:MAG: 1-acyl-sn-glycerol-3-phosphate acyltransferase [Bacteroidota bacterium]